MKPIKKPINAILLIIIVIFATALIAFMVIAFLPKSGEENSGDPGKVTDISTIEFQTPYCTLRYPEQWKDQVTVKKSAVDGGLTVTYCAVIAAKQYELFTVCFGESSKGELFGYLPGDGNIIPVYIECHKITEDAGLTEGEQALFYSMMEGVNEVSRSISSTAGYYAP